MLLNCCCLFYPPFLFYCFFSCIDLTLTDSNLETQTSSSSIFQVWRVSGRFKHQNDLSPYFCILLIKHSFHVMFTLWIWRETPESRQLLSHLMSAWTFRSQKQCLFLLLLNFTRGRDSCSSNSCSILLNIWFEKTLFTPFYCAEIFTNLSV